MRAITNPNTLVLVALMGLAQARFGQEQIPIPAIAAVQGGAPGEAPTIAGAAVSDILAASNACNKLARADEILLDLGTGADAIAAAIGMVSAEKNFNPFTQSIPTICDDPSLPASKQLRGITPLIDPAVGGSDVANALSKKTAANPIANNAGKSIAQLLKENGFSNFTTQGADSTTAQIQSDAKANALSAAAAASQAAAASPVSSSAVAVSSAPAAAACSVAPAASSSAAVSGSGSGKKAGTLNLDFGKCVPTMDFKGGRNGRPADEFTFLPIDPLVAEGQQEALNPNIITNRICDQLVNVCGASDAAIAKCNDEQAVIEALGTRDQSTADKWNADLGFPGAAKVRRASVRQGIHERRLSAISL